MLNQKYIWFDPDDCDDWIPPVTFAHTYRKQGVPSSVCCCSGYAAFHPRAVWCELCHQSRAVPGRRTFPHPQAAGSTGYGVPKDFIERRDGGAKLRSRESRAPNTTLEVVERLWGGPARDYGLDNYIDAHCVYPSNGRICWRYTPGEGENFVRIALVSPRLTSTRGSPLNCQAPRRRTYSFLPRRSKPVNFSTCGIEFDNAISNRSG